MNSSYINNLSYTIPNNIYATTVDSNSYNNPMPDIENFSK